MTELEPSLEIAFRVRRLSICFHGIDIGQHTQHMSRRLLRRDTSDLEETPDGTR
jgi:hypothetical protein